MFEPQVHFYPPPPSESWASYSALTTYSVMRLIDRVQFPLFTITGFDSSGIGSLHLEHPKQWHPELLAIDKREYDTGLVYGNLPAWFPGISKYPGLRNPPNDGTRYLTLNPSSSSIPAHPTAVHPVVKSERYEDTWRSVLERPWYSTWSILSAWGSTVRSYVSHRVAVFVSVFWGR